MAALISTKRSSRSQLLGLISDGILPFMSTERTHLQEQRGLRFSFNAEAEVVAANAPGRISARMTELSFRGCFLELSATLKVQQRLHVKIFHAGLQVEVIGHVLYLRPNGVGLLFSDIPGQCRKVLQAWILSAMDEGAPNP